MSTKTLRAFVSEVRAYCGWCEYPKENETDYAAARTALQRVSTLQQIALRMEQPDDAPDVRLRSPSQEDWQLVHRRLKTLPFGFYNSLFDPHKDVGLASGLGVGDLLDDLADIWRDLRHGLDLWDAGHELAAQWEWAWSFQNHWGRHAAAAQYALHCWMADYGGWHDPGEGG